MVKLKGPALAQKASGTMAGQLVFSHTARGAYMKLHSKPKQPRSDKQVAVRAIMSFLSSQWNQISDADKATWQELADESEITPFNAYLGENCRLWRNFKPPSRFYPPTGLGNYAYYDPVTATAIPGGIYFWGGCTGPGYGWGLCIIQTAVWAGPATWHGLKHIMPIREELSYAWQYKPLDPGTYYFRICPIRTSGKMWLPGDSRQATVT